jgi:hypothetical protein
VEIRAADADEEQKQATIPGFLVEKSAEIDVLGHG